jgi:heat shock protein HtpX
MQWQRDLGLSTRVWFTMLLLLIVNLIFLAVLSYLGIGIYGLIGFAFLLAFVQYFFSDRLVLWSTGAREVSRDEFPEVYAMVEKLAKEAELPMPKVAVMQTPVPNAFATGRGPSNSVVAVTTGLTRALNEDELEGVLSHEISHIKHRDVLVATVVATIAGAISYLALVGRLGAYTDSRNSNASIFALILSFLAPLAAFMVQTAISRGREYEADSDGAMLSKKPLSLANALEKIERVARSGAQIKANPSTSSLWIVNPFRGEGVITLFSTHPPTARRVERLREIAGRIGSMK